MVIVIISWGSHKILIKSWKIISSFPLSSDDFAVKLLHGHRNRINDFNKCKWCLRSREDPQEMKIIVTLIKNIASSLSESAEDCARRQMSSGEEREIHSNDFVALFHTL